MDPSLVRKVLDITGIVQGVGFRPAVFRLAARRGLTGTIANTDFGVSVEIQGATAAVEEFVQQLPLEAPEIARILALEVQESAVVDGEDTLRIVPSRAHRRRLALVLPDVATCADCLSEILDPEDRRFRYPFTNCTYCGPRFTIVRDIPYDRPLTALDAFPMCAACRAEYEDPEDRRFHAQATACADCGPQLALLDMHGDPVTVADPMAEVVARLRGGEIVAIKGIGGFHLAVNAHDAAAVARLRARKQRVEKPFAIMVPNVEAARAVAAVDEVSERLLSGYEQPIVLLRRRPGSAVVHHVAPGNAELGVFLPYTPVHHLLFRDGRFEALVMTSANLSEEPIACDNDEAVRRLEGIADCFLVHDRAILTRCDDGVVRVRGGRARQLRRSRGSVPVPLMMCEDMPPILAVGAQLKNTVCITRGRYAFLSQHVGDLENVETLAFFEEVIAHMTRILGVEPCAIAHDLHPNYLATQWALRQVTDVPRIAVQHHHAHIAACMAENGIDGGVIGIALDGTGYGTDGMVWGGEVLLSDYEDFRRVAHLEYVSMPGGAAAIREPWRMAVAWLLQHYGSDLPADLPFMRSLDSTQVALVRRMIERGVHCPSTSSCGRLFDAVAALLGVRSAVNYEAQAAIELEATLDESADEEAYPFEVRDSASITTIGTRPMFDALLLDARDGVSVATAGRRFHNGLAKAFAGVADRVRARHGLDRVCLSGGCFQNAFLAERLEACLRADRFEVFTHAEVPPGDGGLALGQAVIAARRLRNVAS